MQDARASRIPCYLVGGPVRDLLLGYEFDDLDLVFEGDALAIAERCAALTGGELVRHEAFATGKLAFNNTERPFHIDFITARRETYPYPASLPVVEPSTLADDLMRRDFTINTLAIRLDDPPRLIDQLGGIADLERGTIQVLHDRSFIDDPTRILRGARFAARLHFTVEPHTDTLVRKAGDLDMIAATTPARILNEVWLAFREPEPEAVFAILADLRILPHIFPGLHVATGDRRAFQAARQAVQRRSTTARVARPELCGGSMRTNDARYCEHYHFNGGRAPPHCRIGYAPSLYSTPSTAFQMPPSALDRALHDLSDTTLTVGMIVASPPDEKSACHVSAVLATDRDAARRQRLACAWHHARTTFSCLVGRITRGTIGWT